MTKGSLKRFVRAQKTSHNTAVEELCNGYKESCWMWFTFPQIKGLGYSDIAKYYEFQCMGEVRAFAANEYLNQNITELMEILLELRDSDADYIFGEIDARKLQSSMTVLGTTQQLKGLAEAVLAKFFDGEHCRRTLEIIESMEDK